MKFLTMALLLSTLTTLSGFAKTLDIPCDNYNANSRGRKIISRLSVENNSLLVTIQRKQTPVSEYPGVVGDFFTTGAESISNNIVIAKAAISGSPVGQLSQLNQAQRFTMKTVESRRFLAEDLTSDSRGVYSNDGKLEIDYANNLMRFNDVEYSVYCK